MNINHQNYQEFNIVREPNYLNEKTTPHLSSKRISIIFIKLLVTGDVQTRHLIETLSAVITKRYSAFWTIILE